MENENLITADIINFPSKKAQKKAAKEAARAAARANESNEQGKSEERKLIRYDEVKVGDVCWVKTDNVKNGEALKVVKVDQFSEKPTSCYRVFFENGDMHAGWSDRFLQLAV